MSRFEDIENAGLRVLIDDTGQIMRAVDQHGRSVWVNNVPLFQSGIPFGILPGDGGANGLTFTDSIGNFTLSAAVITDFYRAFAGGGYIYFPAGTAGSLDGSYFAVMFSDTAGRV